MIIIKRENYRTVIRDGKRIAIMTCPQCNKRGSLGDHQIADDGTVTPSVVCITEGCTFHDWVQLDAWNKEIK